MCDLSPHPALRESSANMPRLHLWERDNSISPQRKHSAWLFPSDPREEPSALVTAECLVMGQTRGGQGCLLSSKQQQALGVYEHQEEMLGE